MTEPSTTKELIMHKSAKLFSTDGYGNVSMKIIAKACGIQPASIYNHYASKEDILHALLNYYRENNARMRPTEEDVLPILRGGSGKDIINAFTYDFFDLDEPDGGIMYDILLIILHRQYIDPDVSRVFKESIVDEGIEHVIRVLEIGRRLGRIQNPSEDLPVIAYIIMSCRVFIAGSAVSDPNSRNWDDLGNEMSRVAGAMLDLAPPLPEGNPNDG